MLRDFLLTVSIFSDINKEELDELVNICTIRKYPKGSMIILEEEYGDKLFIVKTGTVKITRVNDEGKEVILALLGISELFGEMAILDGESRSANVLAQEKCELIVVSSEDFLNLLKNNFNISFAIMSELAKKIRKSDMQIEALSLSDAEHRIGASILNLAEDMGVIRNGKVTIQNLPFQQDIANMAGTSRETVSRTFKLLEEKGLVTREGRKLTIYNFNQFTKTFS